MRIMRLIGAIAVLLGMASPSGAVPPGGPDGSFSYSPGNPQPGQSVTFTIQARDSDGTFSRVTLDYGDGTKDNVPTPHSFADDLSACVVGSTFVGHLTHQYAAAGSYNVKLTVTAGSCPLTGPLQEATMSTSKTIPVGPRASAPPGGGGGTGGGGTTLAL